MQLLFLLFFPSALATPATIELSVTEAYGFLPGIRADTLDWYRDDQATYLVGPQQHRWMVDRAGFVAVEEEAPEWLYGLGYRRDQLEGPHDTVLGGLDDVVVDLVDPTLPPLVEGHSPWTTVHDVDGDGTVDLMTRRGLLLLMSSPDPITADMPPFDGGRPFFAHPKPLPDLDGDGHAEIADAASGYVTYGGAATQLFVHDGSPDGYDPQPRWSIPVDGEVLDVISVQADADPEPELLLLTVSVVPEFSYSYSSVFDARTVLVDDVHTDAPLLRPTLGVAPNTELLDFFVPRLENLGDVDGDTLDDVVLTATNRDWAGELVDLQILTAAAGYDVDQPVASFRIGSDPNDSWTDEVHTLAVDIDEDGHMDLVACKERGIATLQVWFGPLVEPPTPDHTGDTGASRGTGDTAGRPFTPTADTSSAPTSTEDTAGAPYPARPRGTDDPGCGCQQAPRVGSWLRTMSRRH